MLWECDNGNTACDRPGYCDNGLCIADSVANTPHCLCDEMLTFNETSNTCYREFSSLTLFQNLSCITRL